MVAYYSSSNAPENKYRSVQPTGSAIFFTLVSPYTFRDFILSIFLILSFSFSSSLSFYEIGKIFTTDLKVTQLGYITAVFGHRAPDPDHVGTKVALYHRITVN